MDARELIAILDEMEMECGPCLAVAVKGNVDTEIACAIRIEMVPKLPRGWYPGSVQYAPEGYIRVSRKAAWRFKPKNQPE